MKLSLEELKVESYSAQVCEQELENVKGGTGWTCFKVAFETVGLGAAVAQAIYNEYTHWLCSNSPSSGMSGYLENDSTYIISSDTIVIYGQSVNW